MEFIADGMLGKLARWLRILGYSVQYSSELDDTDLLLMAEHERRILLTKDLRLFRLAVTKGIEAFYLHGKREDEKLGELATRFKIRLEVDMAKSRCPNCNAQLKRTRKAELENQVEKNTFLHYDKFWKCPDCGQIYWQGAHWRRIESTLRSAKEYLQKNR